MNAIDVIERVINSENGGLYAVIGGNLLAFTIDRVTKYRYKVNAKKKMLTFAPADIPRETDTGTEEPENTEN